MISRIDASETSRDLTGKALLRSQFMVFLLRLALPSHYIQCFAFRTAEIPAPLAPLFHRHRSGTAHHQFGRQLDFLHRGARICNLRQQQARQRTRT